MRKHIWIAFVIGCGGGDGGDDANGMDAGGDAPPPDTLACTPQPGSAPVMIDGPDDATTLVIHDPSGAVLSSQALAARESVSVAVPACGMVTIYTPSPGDRPAHADTWTGVQPGDHLTHVERTPVQLVERAVRVQLPALQGATQYQLSLACPMGGASFAFNPTPGDVDLTPNCLPGATTVTVIATATGPAGTSFALAIDAPVAPTGSTTVALGGYQPGSALTASVANPGALAGGDLLVAVIDRVTPASPVLASSGRGPVSGVQLAAPQGDDNYLAFRLATEDRTIELHRAFATVPATIALDRSADFLPDVDGTLTADPLRPTVVWTAPGVAADLAGITIDHDMGEAGVLRWGLLVPARPGKLQYPAMPPELVKPGTPALLALVVIESGDWASYDEARSHLDVLGRAPSGTEQRQSQRTF